MADTLISSPVCVQIFSEAPDSARWMVAIHHVVVHNMVAMATEADQAQRLAGNAAPGKLSAAATYLQSSIFSDTLRKGTDPHPSLPLPCYVCSLPADWLCVA